MRILSIRKLIMYVHEILHKTLLYVAWLSSDGTREPRHHVHVSMGAWLRMCPWPWIGMHTCDYYLYMAPAHRSAHDPCCILCHDHLVRTSRRFYNTQMFQWLYIQIYLQSPSSVNGWTKHSECMNIRCSDSLRVSFSHSLMKHCVHMHSFSTQLETACKGHSNMWSWFHWL